MQAGWPVGRDVRPVKPSEGTPCPSSSPVPPASSAALSSRSSSTAACRRNTSWPRAATSTRSRTSPTAACRSGPIDFNDPASLRAAFAGAEKVLLVSGSEVGQRVEQHQNVIDAAPSTGVGLLVYTSIAHADSTRMQLAADHQATEAALRASGVPVRAAAQQLVPGELHRPDRDLPGSTGSCLAAPATAGSARPPAPTTPRGRRRADRRRPGRGRSMSSAATRRSP